MSERRSVEFPTYHYTSVTDPQTGKQKPYMPTEMLAAPATPPASGDVEAAREALRLLITEGIDATEEIDAFEAAIRAESADAACPGLERASDAIGAWTATRWTCEPMATVTRFECGRLGNTANAATHAADTPDHGLGGTHAWMPVGAYVASALMAANIECDSGEDVDRFLAELARRGFAIRAESGGLDVAWAEAVAALPAGWALWGVRFRAPGRGRARGQYEAWAGPVGLTDAAPWPRPSRGLSGYSADSPAAALLALAARLAEGADKP